MTVNPLDGAGAARWLVWLAHGLALLSGAMLVGAAWGWIAGGAEVVGARTGVVPDSAAASALALQLGLYKGLLDLWPLPLALVAAVWGAYRTAAAVWAVAVVVIPVADIGLAVASAGEVVLHLPYLGVMAGAALAYLAAARQAGG